MVRWVHQCQVASSFDIECLLNSYLCNTISTYLHSTKGEDSEGKGLLPMLEMDCFLQQSLPCLHPIRLSLQKNEKKMTLMSKNCCCGRIQSFSCSFSLTERKKEEKKKRKIKQVDTSTLVRILETVRSSQPLTDPKYRI